MAVTSLWHVKGSIKDVIDYIENPEKTVPNQDMQDFFDVFSYVKNPSKTNEGEYVSAINCLKETALQQMILTKKQYQKTGGYIASTSTRSQTWRQGRCGLPRAWAARGQCSQMP